VDYITGAGAMLTRDIKDNLNYKKDGNKGFETVITRLQMETYVVISAKPTEHLTGITIEGEYDDLFVKELEEDFLGRHFTLDGQ